MAFNLAFFKRLVLLIIFLCASLVFGTFYYLKSCFNPDNGCDVHTFCPPRSTCLAYVQSR